MKYRTRIPRTDGQIDDLTARQQHCARCKDPTDNELLNYMEKKEIQQTIIYILYIYKINDINK